MTQYGGEYAAFDNEPRLSLEYVKRVAPIEDGYWMLKPRVQL